jgi:hypothetical protein
VSDDILVDQPRFIHDFAAILRAADKIVYSRSLESPSSARTRIERTFDPDAIPRLKATAKRDMARPAPLGSAVSWQPSRRSRSLQGDIPGLVRLTKLPFSHLVNARVPTPFLIREGRRRPQDI